MMNKNMKFCNAACRSLHDIDVPLEKGEWMELGYLMRTIAQYPLVTEKQKQEIQQLLLETFKKKDYLPEQYDKVISEIEEIRHSECRKQVDGLEEMVEGMSKVIAGMTEHVGTLADRQITNIFEMKTISDKVSTTIKERRPRHETLSLLSQLKEKCKFAFNNISEIQRTLKEESTFDSLTRLYTRRAFDNHIMKTVTKFKEEKDPLSLIFIDIDNFKMINDTYGHQVGDQVLATVSGEVKKGIRSSDHVARYGGEEIVVLLDGANMQQARNRADSIRENRESHEFVIRKTQNRVSVTVSIGVSECHQEWITLPAEEIISSFIEEADTALYRAKEKGRNMVCAA